MEAFPVTAANFKAGAQYWMDDFCADTGCPKDAINTVINRCAEDDPRLQTLADKINAWHGSKSKPATPSRETTVKASDLLRSQGINVTRITPPPSHEPAAKAAKTAAPKKEGKAKKAAAPKTAEPAYDLVPELSEAEKIIKAYVRLDGARGLSGAQSLLKRLQHAIVTRRIRKTDPRADMVVRVQKGLIEIMSKAGTNTEIKIKNADEFINAVGLLRNDPAINALKTFIAEAVLLTRIGSQILYDGMAGGEQVAKMILAKLESAGGEACKRAAEYMRSFLEGRRDTPIYEYELSGLRGLAGI